MATKEPSHAKRDFQSLEVVEIELPNHDNCYGLALDSDGNLFATLGNSIVRCKRGDTSAVIYAGGSTSGRVAGSLLSSRFSSPLGLLWHEDALYVAHSHGIMRIANEQTEFFAGIATSGYHDGPNLSASFNNPTHIVALHGAFYVTDTFNHAIRKILDGNVTTLVKTIGESLDSNGPFGEASLRYPRGLCVSPDENLILSQSSNDSCLRVIDLEKEEVRKLEYKHPRNYSFAMDVQYASTKEIIVCDTTAEYVYIVDSSGEEHTLMAAQGNQLLASTHRVSRPTASCISAEGDLYCTREKTHVRIIKRMFPPKETAHFDFSSSIQISSSMPTEETSTSTMHDMVLHHKHSGKSIALSSAWAKLLPISTPQALENSSVPFEVCESFFKLLLGSHPSIPSNTSASTLAYYVELIETMGVSFDVKRFVLGALSSAIAPLPLLDLKNLLSQMNENSSETEAATLVVNELKIRSKGGSKSEQPDIAALLSSIKIDSLPKSSSLLQASDPSDVSFPSLSMWLQSRLGMLTASLQVAGPNTVVITPELADYPPNFTIEIPSPEGLYIIGVHDWVLMPRWSFYRRMMESGLIETSERKATLPGDFSPTAAIALIRYIYCAVVDEETLTSADCEYLSQNAGAYGIVDYEDIPALGFEPFVQYYKSKAETQ